MMFVSTRGGDSAPLDRALKDGMARDGGLFVPDYLPEFEGRDFESASSLHEIAGIVLTPFFEDSELLPDLADIIRETFSFPIPLTRIAVTSGNLHLLELFHGPTAAFKDVGAGFLAACLSRLQKQEPVPLTILVATSGDTGGAVAAAFNERPGMQVAVLFPFGRVSERQARQLTCWGGNVLSLAVEGSFDDCQALVKAAMGSAALSGRYRFSSANSINIGRLLPQCIYYCSASLAQFRATGRKPSFIVPSGNLGNGLALILAKRMGFPIGDVVLATNANRVIVDYLESGEWQPGDSIRTLASAMDVGNPSNMERLRKLFANTNPGSEIRGISVTDSQIEQEIRADYAQYGTAICPHTATACYAYRQLDEDERRKKDWIAVATAHPAKFEQIVEPLIGGTLPLPEPLRETLSRPVRSVSIQPDLSSFEAALAGAFRLDDGRATGQE
jgi:threonine synthase